MPNYFTLTRRSDLESGPVVLQRIDDEMRVHFGEPPDKDNWYLDWYNWIGLSLSMGRSFAHIRDAYCAFLRQQGLSEDCRHVEVIDWLDANFTSNAWATVGR
jgi:hypothetical protein